MGVIYSVEQIEAGHVPEPPDAHYSARDMLLDWADSDHPGLVGAMAYGTSTRTPTRRSDLDVFMVLEDASTPEVGEEIRQLFREIHGLTRVHIEPGVWRRELIRNGSFSSNPAYIASLKAQPEEDMRGAEDIRKLLPFNILTPSYLASFVLRKLHAFTHASFGANGTPEMATLQRALELPNAIGRTALQLHGDFKAPVNTANETIQAARPLLAKYVSDGYGAFDKLAELDREYSKQLEAVIVGTSTVAEYSQMLDYLSRTAPALAHGWLQSIYPQVLAEHNRRSCIKPSQTFAFSLAGY